MKAKNLKNNARRIVNLIQGIYIELSPNGIIVAFESFLKNETGFTPGKICGKSWSDVFDPVDTEITGWQGLRHRISDKDDQTYLYTIQSQTGDKLFIEWRFDIARDANGDSISTVGIGQNVTSRKIRDEVLQERQLELLEKNRTLTCLYKIAEMVVDDNDAFATALQNITDLIPHAFECPEKIAAIIRLDKKNHQTPGFEKSLDRCTKEIRIRGKARGCIEVGRLNDDPDTLCGKKICTAEEEKLLESVARKVAYIVERKEAKKRKQALEEQLRHADRLATIGQLAAGIAHELNNPLGDILGFAQLASNFPDLPEQVYKDLIKIVKSTLYAREVIKKILLFSRQSLPHEGKVNLNKLIEDWVDFFEFRCKQYDIDIALKMDQNLSSVSGDPSQLNQVLINLVVNAIHAMPKGGVLTINTSMKSSGISLRVQDTGEGIEADIRDKIFLPFFTTKEVDQGTGLGLSVVYGIINEHGGSINVDSRVGKGSTFDIFLPFIKDDGEKE